MSRNVPSRQVDPSNKIVGKVVDCIREEVKRRYGSELTFEQRRDAAVAVTNDSLWLDEKPADCDCGDAQAASATVTAASAKGPKGRIRISLLGSGRCWRTSRHLGSAQSSSP